MNNLNQIGTRGQGLGEYRYISNFEIYPETRNVYVTEGKLNQILIYFSDGKFKNSINISAKYTSAFGIVGIIFFYFTWMGLNTIKKIWKCWIWMGILLKAILINMSLSEAEQ